MRHLGKATWLLGALGALVWLGGCEDNRPTGPGQRGIELPAFAVIVSDPAGSFSASIAGSGNAAVAGSGDSVTYVSLAPGTVVRGSSVEIRNLTSGFTRTELLIGGGLDPVPVRASAGDTLRLTATDGSEITAVAMVVVARRRSPRIVRTEPPKGKRDVPLNSVIQVVFSEPIDPRTLTQTSARLLRDGVAVEGRLDLIHPHLVTATLAPAEPLAQSTRYEIIITNDIRDLDGEPLEEPVTAEFTTGLAPAQPSFRQLNIFSGSPAMGVAGRSLAPFEVWERCNNNDNCYSRTVTGSVTVALGANPRGATLSGTTTVAAVDGRATFTDLSIDKGGVGYSLVATASGWGSDTSGTIAMMPIGRIAFVRGREYQDGAESDIYVMGEDAAVAKLTHGAAYHLEPAWSPDGKKLAFTKAAKPYDSLTNDFDRYGCGRDGEVHVMNSDGTGSTRLTSGAGDDCQPAWSPDGTRIAFTRWSGGSAQIYVMNADGSGVSRLSDGNGRDIAPAWSPDGSKIAFSTSRAGTYNSCYGGCYWLASMNPDGSGVAWMAQSFTGGIDEHINFAWSPDGRSSVVQSGNAYTGWWIMPFWANGQEPAWSPDGAWVASFVGQASWAPGATICIMGAGVLTSGGSPTWTR